MKRTILLALGSTALLATTASAETLQQALEAAYARNPTLAAQRANVRATDENVPLARAAGLPSIDGTVSYQENILKGDQPANALYSDPDRQFVAQAALNVPLVTFGAVGGTVRAAKARVDASQLGLRSTESEIFTAVVGAYMDVIRDEASVRLNRRNREVIEYTYEETRKRHAAGERGETDLAQAEARVALAISQLETAEARLVSSRENYVRLVGNAPGELRLPPPLPSLPASVDEALATALQDNPQLLTSRSNVLAARHDITAADAEKLPRLNATAGVNQYDYLGSLAGNTDPRNRDKGTTGYVGVTLKVPIYQGGRPGALSRQSREKYAMALEQQTEAERNAVAQTRSAYANWQSASRVVQSSTRGVAANRKALDGVRAETNAGMRPLLDLLNAEQELLNAEVTLVTAERDAYVAGFALLGAMGRAEARHLNFDSVVLYDPTIHYDRARRSVGDWSGGPLPEPTASSTTTVPAQDADLVGPR